MTARRDHIMRDDNLRHIHRLQAETASLRSQIRWLQGEFRRGGGMKPTRLLEPNVAFVLSPSEHHTAVARVNEQITFIPDGTARDVGVAWVDDAVGYLEVRALSGELSTEEQHDGTLRIYRKDGEDR